MSQSQQASATAADPQPVARSGPGNAGNGRGPQQSARSSASAPVKQGSQPAPAPKPSVPAPQKANGSEAPPKNSWANIARATPPAPPINGAAAVQEKPAAPAVATPAPAAATGVKLPAGVTTAPAAQRSIKFGSIDPAELQQQNQAPAAAAAAPLPKPAPINTSVPSAKPVSFAAAAAAAGTAAPKPPAAPAAAAPAQRGGGGAAGNASNAPRSARGPQQQPVPPVAIQQGGGFGSQAMPTAFILSPGAPVAYPQAYMLYNPSVSTQQYFAGGFGQPGQYPGFQYGTPPQGQGVPSGPHGGPQAPVGNMPVPPPPPQASGANGPHGTPYGSTPTSPLPPKGSGSAPPARQKKILRIENPDTHEVLNLADIKQATSKPTTPLAGAAAEQAAKSFKDVALAEKKLHAEAAKFQPAAKPEPKKVEAPKEAIPAPKEAPKQQPKEEPKAQPAAEVAKEPVKETKAEPVVAAPAAAAPAPAAAEPAAAEAAAAPVAEPAAEAPKKEEPAEVAAPAAAPVAVPEAPPTSNGPAPPEEKKVQVLADNGKKRYTTDFLLQIRPLCKDLPPHVEAATLSALAPKPGEENRGPTGPPDRADWKAGPRGGGPPGGVPGGPPGMRGGRQNSRRPQGGIDGDTWERGKPLPAMQGGNQQFGGRGPPPGMRMPGGPVPALHKTDSAYKIGKVITDDPEEEKAQKSLKSMLNKITPQNFDKITAQIVDKVNERKKAKTLSGFINQIFDKALIETTFSELYANLVASLNPALPELEDDEGNPVQFRRTLLNKCQEEFETGASAMKAVAEREKRAHDEPVAEEEEVEEVVVDTEEGEISEELLEKKNAAEAKRKDREAAAEEVKARKRMLGNIIFVGQLYRFGVLTETVMHSCIKQLLEETQNPRTEDVECLCKLLTTVGRPMDNSARSVKQTDENGNVTSITTRDMMGAYFKRIDALSKNEALDSRHRFMLHDLIDLRRNNWVLRRQAEGPKKIDEIHRDAAMERSRSQMLDRQQSRGGRDQPRGPPRAAFDNRVDAPIRTMNRVGSQDSLGSQSFRPGGRPAPPPRPTALPASERPPQAAAAAAKEAEPAATSEETTPEPEEVAADVEALTEEQAEGKVKGLLAEVYNSRDLKEAALCVKELQDGKANMANVIEQMLTVSLESKATSWETLRDLLKAAHEEKMIEQADFEQGARQLLNKLDDLTVDVPKAPMQVAEVLTSLIANGAADLSVIAKHIVEADAEPVPEGEDSMMVDSGVALKVVGVLLKGLKEAQGAEAAAAGWKSAGIDYKSYIASADRESEEFAEKFKADYDLADML